MSADTNAKPTKPPYDIYAGTWESGHELDYKIAVMTEFKRTGFVRYKRNRDPLDSGDINDPSWDWITFEYRIPARFRPEPKKKLVPFTLETFPNDPAWWFRGKNRKICFRPIAIGCIGVECVWTGLELVRYSELWDAYEMSRDRQTWVPCGVEVEVES